MYQHIMKVYVKYSTIKEKDPVFLKLQKKKKQTSIEGLDHRIILVPDRRFPCIIVC